VLRKAFIAAIRRTRQAIGFRGFYKIDRCEEAQLALLIIQAYGRHHPLHRCTLVCIVVCAGLCRCVFQFDVPSALSATPLSDDKEDTRREEVRIIAELLFNTLLELCLCVRSSCNN
jgi:hypothetical protein